MPPTRKLKRYPVRKPPRYGEPTFAGLPRICRYQIIETCSISTLLALYSTCSSLRRTIPRSPTIVDEVFSRVHGFVGESLPPAMSAIMAADPHLHPLFAQAIVESYDGFDFGNSDHGGVSGRYLVFLINRCAVVHSIDVAFSRASSSIVEGLGRKMALMAFWKMLDCIENWTKDKKKNGPGGDIHSEEYFGWCVDIVGGFKHMVKTDEEKADICEAVGLFYSLAPQYLIKGWAPGRAWSYLGWRSKAIGFCLLGGLERVSNALEGKYYLGQMRDPSGLETQIARGISSWMEFEGREREKKRIRLEAESGVGGPSSLGMVNLIEISDDSDDDYSQPAADDPMELIELSD